MKLALIEIVFDPEVIGLSKSRGDFYIREERFEVIDKSPFFAAEGGENITVLGFGPAGGENLLREFLALGADKGVYLTIPDYRLRNFDLYPVAKYIKEKFADYEIYTSNEEIFYRLKDMNIILVKEKVEGRLPTAIQIVKSRKKPLVVATDFSYRTGFRYIGGEPI